MNKNTSYGYFCNKNKGSYIIKDTLKLINADYFYQNKDILLRVDKYGMVSSQYLPPKDIMLFRRNDSDRFSKWHVWVECLQTKQRISNFSFPRTVPPVDGYIKFSPEKAIYYYEYQDFSITTEIGIPYKGSSIMSAVTVNNHSKQDLDFKITPAVYPYINHAQIPPWDKVDWYLETSAGKRKGVTEFVTRMNTPTGIKENRRLATFQVSGNPSIELSMEDFCGNGSFDCPDMLDSNELNIDNDMLSEDVFSKTHIMQCYPPVYACRYSTTITAGSQKCFTQVLTMQGKENCGVYNHEQAQKSALLLDEINRTNEHNKITEFFDSLFSKVKIKTEDAEFDNYVNYFLPLQMYWVASLDRGWPTGMRGVRDAANDFMGMLYYNTKWAKEILIYLFSCQRNDGWFPRQVSDESRNGKHDLRPYVDGGAFLLELLYNYLAYTGDYEILKESLPWLNKDEKNSLYEHALKAVDYYISNDNLGEHGLCKIYGGDWLDAVNFAGLEGRGESVMVSAQTVINLNYMAEIVHKFVNDKVLSQYYIQKAESLKYNINNHAYNKGGFFNSIFNDNGEWIFSDKDPDGQRRVYGPSNYYALLCGAADIEMENSIWSNIESLKCESGYKLFSPALGKQHIEKVGRIASGDTPDGQWENASVYNHGSHGFMLRALAYSKRGNQFETVMQYLLPYNQNVHPVEKTKTGPYAIVNCYQNLSMNKHRGGMTFLTGSIAMAVRAVYDWMFGLKLKQDGIEFCPCFKSGNINRKLSINIRGKKLNIIYTGINIDNRFILRLNGMQLSDQASDKYNISFDSLSIDNKLEVIFK